MTTNATTTNARPYFTWGDDPALDAHVLGEGRKLLDGIERARHIRSYNEARRATNEAQRRFDTWAYSVALCHGETYLDVVARVESFTA